MRQTARHSDLDINLIANEITAVLEESGADEYFGEAVSKRVHAEQCAFHAEQAGADEELIIAALLHDIGHLLEDDSAHRHERVGVVNHDKIGEEWLLQRGFSTRVAALVGGHVDAKRYLTATNPGYMQKLSPASAETLQLQGGPMSVTQAELFSRDPGLHDKLRLRTWDEMAKDPSWRGPGVHSYRKLIVKHLQRQRGGVQERDGVLRSREFPVGDPLADVIENP